MTWHDLIPTLELIVVIGILCLDLMGLVEQRKTGKLVRAYWAMRKDNLAKKLLSTPKPKEKAPEVVKTPEAQ